MSGTGCVIVKHVSWPGAEGGFDVSGTWELIAGVLRGWESLLRDDLLMLMV